MIEQTFKDIYDEELAKGAIINDRMEGFREDYLLLHILLRKYKIKNCFEVGTHTGWGTKIIKNALGNDSMVFSLDLPDENSYLSKQHPLSEGKKAVGFECDLPFISLRGDSRFFDYSKYPCDGAWVDGEHVYENVFCETKGLLSVHTRLIVYHDADEIGVLNAVIDAMSGSEYEVYRVTDTRILYCIKQGK